LKIVFPFEFLLGVEIKIPVMDIESNIKSYELTDSIDLFDQYGLIGKIEVDSFKMEFWCENDGGIQLRPTIKTTILKSNLLRPFLKADNYNIISFASINQDNNFKTLDLTNNDLHIKRTGDYNFDGKSETVLWMVFDEAQNCDNGMDSLIILKTNDGNYRMSCCGP